MRMSRIGIWTPRRDERSGVLIGAVGTRRSDWPCALETINSTRAETSGRSYKAVLVSLVKKIPYPA